MSVNLAIVGASGAVGKELLTVLEQRDFPVGELQCFASEKSAGQQILFRGKPHFLKTLTKDSFKDVDIAIFSAGSKVSREWAPFA